MNGLCQHNVPMQDPIPSFVNFGERFREYGMWPFKHPVYSSFQYSGEIQWLSVLATWL